MRARRFFERLGTLIEQRWKKENFDEVSFPAIALRALEEMPPAEYTDAPDIVQWVLSGTGLPPQDLTREPPFTLYHHPLFRIGAFVWLQDEHLPVHQHCVSGAFHHLTGASLHCLFRFKLKERINSRLLLGDLQLQSIECLRTGDSRPIENGTGTMHATFHLHRPTITIIIQTHLDKEALPQYSYFEPSVGYDASAKNPLLSRQLELLKVMHDAGDPDYLSHLHRRLSRSDFEETFLILKQSYELLERKEFDRLIEVATKSQGRRARLFLEVFEEMRRIDNIIARRPFLRSEHNLLLGLLVYLPDRESIFRFVQWHFGGDPIVTIIRWLEEIAGIKADDSAEANALGIHFDELSLHVFQYLLQGLSFAAIKERLKKQYDPGEVQAQEKELQALCAAFRKSSLFKPLFVSNARGQAIQNTGRKWISSSK